MSWLLRLWHWLQGHHDWYFLRNTLDGDLGLYVCSCGDKSFGAPDGPHLPDHGRGSRSGFCMNGDCGCAQFGEEEL